MGRIGMTLRRQTRHPTFDNALWVMGLSRVDWGKRSAT